MILLSLASKQIWPQVLGLLQMNPCPDRLVLLHTNEENESKGPAQRLSELVIGQGLLPDGAVDLVLVPHDDLRGIAQQLECTAKRLGLNPANCQVNITGGNKLMALAAAEWCRMTGTPCFYLERDFRVFPFVAGTTGFQSQEPYQLDPHLAGRIEPLALLRCQLGAAEVVGPGQCLTLNDHGRSLKESEFGVLLRKDEDFKQFLNWDEAETQDKPGFALEFATAVALLKLGVPVVQRSVRLAPRVLRGARQEEGELDLVFNWAGKLWVVDCKDRNPAESKVGRVRHEIRRLVTPSPALEEMLDQLEEELRFKELHPLKEDLLAISEVGGLLGQGICVRRTPLPLQADEFGRSRRLAVALKDRLIDDLRTILFPNEPASLDQLKSLTKSRTRALS